MKLLYDVLRTTPSRLWAAHIRVGITSVLQNRIGVLYVSFMFFLRECLYIHFFRQLCMATYQSCFYLIVVLVSSEKLQALLLADCMMSILGEDWLLQECDISSQKEVMPVDK